MMKVAEELYQEGFISYPRTETDCFDPAYDLKVPPAAHRPAALPLHSQGLQLSSRLHGLHQGAFPVYPGTGAESERYQSFGELYMKLLRPTYVATVADTSSQSLQALVRDHVQDARWGQHAQRIDSGEMWSNPRSGGHDDKAHPPIHPTRWTAGQPNWHQEKARLYEFIVRSFLASCSKPAVGFQTNIEARIDAELFTTTGAPACKTIWLECPSADTAFTLTWPIMLALNGSAVVCFPTVQLGRALLCSLYSWVAGWAQGPAPAWLQSPSTETPPPLL